ncbi:MAG TPA: hypothetical protein VK638_25555 [Edaphobacter sp.]|nr:hypothetical protein [Edaphobacter sp.]
MRYVKGSIAINERFDLPLLLHVRDARYISQRQLIALLQYGDTDLARKRLAWRVDRLVQAGYLGTLEQRVFGQKIHSIARKGLQYLEARGHQLISVTSAMETFLDPIKMMHSLELVQIRLIFQRSGVLHSWKSDIEVSSENMETGDEYAKDYDAVAILRANEKLLRYGIEYERTTKALVRYRELHSLLANERKLDGVLYFVRGAERLFTVAGHLEGALPGLLFCAADSFELRGVNALFLRSLTQPSSSLRDALGLHVAVGGDAQESLFFSIPVN